MKKEERDIIKEASNELDGFINVIDRIQPAVILPSSIMEHELNYLSLRCALNDALILCDRYDLVITQQILTRLDVELGNQYFTRN